ARGTIHPDRIEHLKSHSDVMRVWRDTKIAPFPARAAARAHAPAREPVPQPCDCSDGKPANGTLADVVKALGVNKIWAAGHRGEGIVIGIVDGGICAIGRRPKAGETARIPNVVDGFPADWGTTGAPSKWGNHGNMTATDALAIAPKAKLYDIRVSGG